MYIDLPVENPFYNERFEKKEVRVVLPCLKRLELRRFYLFFNNYSFPNLEYMKLAVQRIDFRRLPKSLTELEIRVVDIDLEYEFELPKLKVMTCYVMNNSYVLEKIIPKFTGLQTLGLENKFMDINFVENIENLTHISVCRVESLPIVGNLEYLHISYLPNYLTPQLAKYQKLKTLALTNACENFSLRKFADTIKNMPNLKLLDVSRSMTDTFDELEEDVIWELFGKLEVHRGVHSGVLKLKREMFENEVHNIALSILLDDKVSDDEIPKTIATRFDRNRRALISAFDKSKRDSPFYGNITALQSELLANEIVRKMELATGLVIQLSRPILDTIKLNSMIEDIG
jgi:hypothetical protein